MTQSMALTVIQIRLICFKTTLIALYITRLFTILINISIV